MNDKRNHPNHATPAQPASHFLQPAASHRPETVAFAGLGLAGLATLILTVSAMLHFVDGAPQVVARLEQAPATAPAVLATAVVPPTNFVAEAKTVSH